MSERLLLHWQLDDLASGPLVVGTPVARTTGTVEGAAVVRPDERFGSCLELRGGAAAVTSVSALPAPVTAQAWVRVPPMSADAAGVLFGQAEGFTLWLLGDGRLVHQLVTTDGIVKHDTPTGTLTFGEWHHVAVTSEDRTARVLLDGVVVAETALPAPVRATTAPFTLGRDPDAAGSYLDFSAAQVRVHSDTRSVEELRQDMGAGQAVRPSFVRTHPIGFELVDADEQPVLRIDDTPTGQRLTLRLTNSSRHDLTLWPGLGPVSAQEHHVALRFRGGVLAAGSVPTLSVPGWTLTTDAGPTTCYLRGPDALTIPAGQSVELPIAGVRADAAGGTRGSRVELGYRRVGYVGEPTELTGARHQILEIVNDRGRSDPPLHLGLVGGDRVLSDGVTASTLRLRVANLSRDVAVPLTGADGVAPSELVLSFEVQLAEESRDWALTDAGTAGAVDLAVGGPAGGGWQVRREQLGQRAQWTLIPDEDTAVPPDGWWDLTLSEVHGLASPGRAPVLLAYRNIPGFRDGVLAVEVERAPLVFAGSAAGLGTVAPEARLHVVDQSTNGHAGSVIVGPTNQPNLRLGYDRGYSWVQSHGGAPLAINPVGNNVGVGTTAPVARLTVQAVTDHLQLRREEQTGGSPVFLELYQAATPKGVQVYPSIRFHHADAFWHRIEANPDGITFKHGGSEGLIDVHAAVAHAAEVRANRVRSGQVVVTAGSDHLQLRRDEQSGGGALFLELFQAQTPNGVDVYPSIRFHHSHKFWHRIEGRPEGITFKDGGSEGLIDVSAARGTFQALTVDGVSIGAHELRALVRLAAGQLEFDLFNVLQNEFAYAADFSPFDNDRRHVFTWRRKGERVGQGRWRIAFPG
ncbi:LamG-like jellyroll fold domain-containing protein [Micromonospora sp. WMMA1923]|uniref:LamG-like jellyroll fold domain-containing protein n=1 Tax=Micromonospora sp. WMMA1923 TaxID=3404125 RepID=UPI003B942E17